MKEINAILRLLENDSTLTAEQLAQFQQLGQTREGFSIGGAVDAVDVAQQLEAVGDGHVPPKLRALSEHHRSPAHAPFAPSTARAR